MSYILSFIISLHFSFHLISMFYAFYKLYKFFISSYVMPAYSKEVDHETKLYVPKGTSLYETMIYKLYYIV